MTPQNMEKEIEEKVIEYANEFGRPDNKAYLRKALHEIAYTAHLLGEKATLEKVKKALLISLTNEDGSTDVGMFDILWRDVEAYLIIATPTT